METAHAVRLLRLAQVEIITGLKKSAIYEKIKTGRFPVAVRLGSRSVAWRSDEILRCIENRPRAKQEEAV